jgi:hypothetical protein
MNCCFNQTNIEMEMFTRKKRLSWMIADKYFDY